MRALPLLILVTAACSHNSFIGPDGDSGTDAAMLDGSAPDGSTPDGSVAPDGGNAGDQSYQAGSRLKVRYYVSSDGAQQALGFFDSQRNENCSFGPASDNVIRCLPEANAVYGLTLFFADSQCTEPLLAIPNCVASPTEARVAVPNAPTCSGQSQVMAVGTQFMGATMYQKGASTCTSTSTTAYFASFNFYQAGAVISASSFQDATQVTK